MHVRSVHLKYFKKFRDKTLKFFDPETGIPRNLIVLVGNNGSGKSTVLQAIAATIGTATRRIELPSELDWPGFNHSLVGNSWNTPSEANVEVAFSESEATATSEFFQKVPGLSAIPGSQPPSQDRIVHLTLRDGRVRAGNGAQYFQFRGREYAKQVIKLSEEGHDVFKRVGTIFWYTEHRTATSLTGETEVGQKLTYTEDLLRRRLSDFMQFHSRVERNEYQLKPGVQPPFLTPLESIDFRHMDTHHIV